MEIGKEIQSRLKERRLTGGFLLLISINQLSIRNYKYHIKIYIQTIFSKIGPLKRCGIHWDLMGNSKGAADVEYENAKDAAKAIEEFDSNT